MLLYFQRTQYTCRLLVLPPETAEIRSGIGNYAYHGWMLRASILDFIGNAPAGSTDQPDAVHPAGFPIMTNIPNCAGFSFGFKAQ